MLVFPPSNDVWRGKNRPQKRSNSCRTAANTQGKQIKEHWDKRFYRTFVTGQGVMVLNYVIDSDQIEGGFVYQEDGETLAQVDQRGGGCLETFKVRMDKALSSLIYLEMSLITTGVWTRCSGGPFQHKPFCDSMNVLGLGLTYSHHLARKQLASCCESFGATFIHLCICSIKIVIFIQSKLKEVAKRREAVLG